MIRPACSVEVLRAALGGDMMVPIFIPVLNRRGGETGCFRFNPERAIDGVVHISNFYLCTGKAGDAREGKA